MASWFKISYDNNKAKVAHCDHAIETSARSVQWNHSIYPPCNQHIPSRLALSRWFSGVHCFCRISTPSLIGYSSISLSSYTICKISNHQPTVIFLNVFHHSSYRYISFVFLPALMFRITTGLSLPLMNEAAVLAWSHALPPFFGGKSIKGMAFWDTFKLGEATSYNDSPNLNFWSHDLPKPWTWNMMPSMKDLEEQQEHWTWRVNHQTSTCSPHVEIHPFSWPPHPKCSAHTGTDGRAC